MHHNNRKDRLNGSYRNIQAYVAWWSVWNLEEQQHMLKKTLLSPLASDPIGYCNFGSSHIQSISSSSSFPNEYPYQSVAHTSLSIWKCSRDHLQGPLLIKVTYWTKCWVDCVQYSTLDSILVVQSTGSDREWSMHDKSSGGSLHWIAGNKWEPFMPVLEWSARLRCHRGTEAGFSLKSL